MDRFRTIKDGILLKCDVIESPAMRKTFVKRDGKDSRRMSSYPQKHLNESIDYKDDISNPATLVTSMMSDISTVLQEQANLHHSKMSLQ